MHFLIAAPGATLARAPPFFWWPGTTARAHQFAPEGSFQSEETIMARRINAPSPADLITQAIIDRLEAGVRPWIKPWRPGVPSGRPLRANGLPSRGINRSEARRGGQGGASTVRTRWSPTH